MLQKLKLLFTFKKDVKCPWCGKTPKYVESITYFSSVSAHELFCDNDKCRMEVSCFADSKEELYKIWQGKTK